MKRLSNSMERLCLPGSDFDHEELIDCIAKLVRLGQFVEVFLCELICLRLNKIVVHLSHTIYVLLSSHIRTH
jgi:hypothetical protein